jgi:hypothetical protein
MIFPLALGREPVPLCGRERGGEAGKSKIPKSAPTALYLATWENYINYTTDMKII